MILPLSLNRVVWKAGMTSDIAPGEEENQGHVTPALLLGIIGPFVDPLYPTAT